MARDKIEALQDKLHKLSAQRKALKVEAMDVHRQLDALLAEQSAEDRLAAMSDPEKRALLQQLQAEGIGSSEAFGVPGRE